MSKVPPKSKGVIMYTVAGCPFCRRAKELLRREGLKFTEFEISGNEDKADELIALTGHALVPVTLIVGKTIVGFDEEKLNRAIKQFKKS